MIVLSVLSQTVRPVLGVFVDALLFCHLCLRSPAALAAENLFLRKQLGLYIRAQDEATPRDRCGSVHIGAALQILQLA